MSEEASERRNWTGEELDLIVADYFSMLSDEVAGLPFNKAAHNRFLRSKIDRSEGSIEFKHQNISAVLQRLGLPGIRGYLPAANFQKAMIAAIDRYLAVNPVALHPERTASGLAERPGLFVETPPLLLPVTPRREDIERLVRKFNPVERDFRNRKLGREGEELVFHFERERLNQRDRPDLAKKIRWISEEDGDGAGYDILSFDEKGKERFLEVKTTVGSDTTPFYITRNELSLSSERPEAFRLCRVFDFSIRPRMFELAPPLANFVHLSPLSYEASFS
jgi:Protein NO VEIN, C-terminal